MPWFDAIVDRCPEWVQEAGPPDMADEGAAQKILRVEKPHKVTKQLGRKVVHDGSRREDGKKIWKTGDKVREDDRVTSRGGGEGRRSRFSRLVAMAGTLHLTRRNKTKKLGALARFMWHF